MRRSIPVLILLISVASASARPMLDLSRAALHMLRISYETRREFLMGPFYASMRRIDRAIAPNESAAIIVRGPQAIDRAIFVNYYLYPRPGRLYLDSIQYRYACHHEVHRILVDLQHPDVARAVTLDELRAEEMSAQAISVEAPAATSDARLTFIVPIVGASAGAHPADYFASYLRIAAAAPATVTLTFEPAGDQRTLDVAGGQSLALPDIVHSFFGRTGVGWLRVESSAPVTIGASLVNVGQKQQVGIPVLERACCLTAELRGCDRLWLVNATDAFRTVRWNDKDVVLAPHEMRHLPATPVDRLTGPDGVIAFKSRILPDGNTAFEWGAR